MGELGKLLMDAYGYLQDVCPSCLFVLFHRFTHVTQYIC